MKILELHVEGIKGVPGGVDKLALNFSAKNRDLPRWIVFAGRNGAGKSTLMRAIALAIAGPSVARLLAETFSGWIRDGESRANIAVRMQFSEGDSFAAGRRPTFDPWASLSWVRTDGPEPLIERTRVGGNWTPDRGPWAENPKGWFIAGYGPFRRLSPAPTEAQRLMMSPGRPAALASLFREDASLSESVQWLQRIYLQRLEGREDAARLEETVLALLDDGLLPEGMGVEKIDSQGLWVQTPERNSFPLTELSDGYRTVAGLVLDLVKQIHAMNSDVPTDIVEGKVVITQEGVVIIDEIDVHLHVEWQKRIGFWLKDHFPNIQFLVTTHSPFICQAADPGGLIRLSPAWEAGPAGTVVDGEAYNRVVNGSTDEALLTDIFGLESTISERAQIDRERLAALEVAALRGTIDDFEEEELRQLSGRIPTAQTSSVDTALRLIE
ncbi:AAA family ATPase [Arthrobacter sp. 24S4-2]|uniref:AAA family ATPase n=1 Tax=Arthrobacter sp. 24S4-2 TaxID=2575374 RepID=UPI0010C7D436|nr:AAA family ATPase [Arthrobacter sp. 24S4-2]QCO97910.1 AAA family ATPase [Arthrobacter sp. 24S4-2]